VAWMGASLDVRLNSSASFFWVGGEGVPVDYGGVVCHLRII